MTKLEFTRSDEKAEKILQAVRMIDEGKEIEPIRHGRWKLIITVEKLRYQCDQCLHYVNSGTDRRFCPNCGAKMYLKKILEVQWQWDYGVYIPFCPYCNEPAYDEKICFNCGKEYKWVEGKHKSTVIHHKGYTIAQATNNHVTITKNGDLISHSQCIEKLSEDDLKAMVDRLEDEQEAIEKYLQRKGAVESG